MEQIITLFEHMDTAYDAIATAHGFACEGCADNCCETLFFHHTLLEVRHIRQGFGALDEETRAESLSCAARMMEKTKNHDPESGPFRGLCPVNLEGRCAIYEHRPMICRLHGVAHQLAGPGGVIKKGPGCALFENQARPSGPVLDRTPLYREMALMERELRTQTGFMKKIKLTVAEILLYEAD